MDVREVNNSRRITGLPGRTERVPADRRVPRAGEVAISAEAKQAEETLAYVAILKQMSDVREERIAEVREKMSSGDYPDQTTIKETVKKILGG